MSLIPPPSLPGYNFSPEAAREARDKGRLLSMRLELGWTCNFRCLYCNQGDFAAPSNPTTFTEIRSAILQVRDLGGRSVVIVGGGEPTIQPGFRELVTFISECGMVPVLFTNGSGIDRATAEFLYQMGTSVLLKLDSLDESIQDQMAGVKGAYAIIQTALEHLMHSGYISERRESEHRLGVAFVSTLLNLAGIPDLWRFCRERGLYPNHELLILRGRATTNAPRLHLSKEEIAQLKTELLRIDNEFGFDWLPYKPLTGAGCLQYLYSIYLACDGSVRICADVDLARANIRQSRVADILATEPFQAMRHIDGRLRGKCSRCEHSSECMGCRCAAFAMAVQNGCSPATAVLSEDPFCWKPT